MGELYFDVFCAHEPSRLAHNRLEARCSVIQQSNTPMASPRQGAETGDRGDKEASDGALQGWNPMSHVSRECGHKLKGNRRRVAHACVRACALGCVLAQRGHWCEAKTTMGPIIPQRRDQLVIRQDDSVESSQNVQQNGFLRRFCNWTWDDGIRTQMVPWRTRSKKKKESDLKPQLFHKSYFLGEDKGLVADLLETCLAAFCWSCQELATKGRINFS